MISIKGSWTLRVSGLLTLTLSSAWHAGAAQISYMAIPATPVNGFTTTLPGFAGTVNSH